MNESTYLLAVTVCQHNLISAVAIVAKKVSIQAWKTLIHENRKELWDIDNAIFDNVSKE